MIEVWGRLGPWNLPNGKKNAMLKLWSILEGAIDGDREMRNGLTSPCESGVAVIVAWWALFDALAFPLENKDSILDQKQR